MLQKLQFEDAVHPKPKKKNIIPSTHPTNIINPHILKWGCGFLIFSKPTKLCAKRQGSKNFSMPLMPIGLCNSKFPKGVRSRSSKEAFLWSINKLKWATMFPKQKLTQKSKVNHYTWWLTCLWAGKLHAGQVSCLQGLCYLRAQVHSAWMLPLTAARLCIHRNQLMVRILYWSWEILRYGLILASN